MNTGTHWGNASTSTVKKLRTNNCTEKKYRPNDSPLLQLTRALKNKSSKKSLKNDRNGVDPRHIDESHQKFITKTNTFSIIIYQ